MHCFFFSFAVAGGRSRLHLLDLGSCERSKSSGGLTLSGLGNVLLAIFNGQKHLPHRFVRTVAEILIGLGYYIIYDISIYIQYTITGDKNIITENYNIHCVPAEI